MSVLHAEIPGSIPGGSMDCDVALSVDLSIYMLYWVRGCVVWGCARCAR